MLASIVINNHNYAAFLGAAIESALAQTYPCTEVLVVDDGSTDGSRDIITRYAGRITAVCKERGGQASAINVGIERSRGDVILVLDSDDVLYPDTVARVMAVFASQPATAWVQFRLEVIRPDGARTGILKPAEHIPRRGGDLRQAIVAFPFDVMRMATSGNAFAARALRKMLPIPEDVYCPSGADWYLCPLVGLYGTTTFLEDIGGGYRLHGSNNAWFERTPHRIDLKGVRRDLRLYTASARAIRAHAVALGLNAPREVLSVCYMADRMMSLKLDPANHPVEGDNGWKVFGLGCRSALRRRDVHWPMKALYVGWFAAMAVAPPTVARLLAEVFMFPSKRQVLNGMLGRLHVPAVSAVIVPIGEYVVDGLAGG